MWVVHTATQQLPNAVPECCSSHHVPRPTEIRVINAKSKLSHWFRPPLGVEQVLPFNINTDLLTDLDKTGQKVRCDSIQ